jgi:hypothetical protein
MELLLLLVAPVLQIILSVLRLSRKLSVPLSVIFGFAVITGIACSFFASNLVVEGIRAESHGQYVCGMPGLAFVIIGLFITLVSTPIIAIVCYFISRSQNKAKAKLQANYF